MVGLLNILLSLFESQCLTGIVLFCKHYIYFHLLNVILDQGWMSWKRKRDMPVKLIFGFDAPRRFSKATLFTSNLFHLGAQVSLQLD